MKLSDLPQALLELERAARLRVPDDRVERRELEEKFGSRFIDAASNDYLGLAQGEWSGEVPEDVPRETEVAERSAFGAPGSRGLFLGSPILGSRELRSCPAAVPGGPQREGKEESQSGSVSRGTISGGGASSEVEALDRRARAPGDPPFRPGSATAAVSMPEAPGDETTHPPGVPSNRGTSLSRPVKSPVSATTRLISEPASGSQSGQSWGTPLSANTSGSSAGRQGERSGASPPGAELPFGEPPFHPEDSPQGGLPPPTSASSLSSLREVPPAQESSQSTTILPEFAEEGRAGSGVSRETRVQGMDDQAVLLPSLRANSSLPLALSSAALAPSRPALAPSSAGLLALRTVPRTRTFESPPAVGAGSSRLIFGTSPEHLLLEEELAAWVGLPASLLFASGYAANVGALGAVLSPEDAVFSDSLNHASLIDGIRLSRARPLVVPHLNLVEVERGLAQSAAAPARWVVCESYYSMDGDGPNLAALRELCDRYDAQLYVDEAHSLGTFGPQGAGLCAAQGIVPDVLMAAFGKSVGSQGACVAGSAELRTWLWNRARSFVFSTAPSPLLVLASRHQMRRAQAANAERARLTRICLEVRAHLEQAAVPLVQGSFGPVVGLLMGAEERALLLARRLRESGILAQAVRPPTVPSGASRVRLVLRASLSDDQIARLVDVVARETTT